MIEALIKTRGTLSKGDIIQVKLPGSVWGSLELKVHKLVELDDNVLEKRLKDMQKAGVPYPSISNPYAIIEEKIENGKKVISVVEKSSKYVDFSSIDVNKRKELEDNTKTYEKLKATDYTLADKGTN